MDPATFISSALAAGAAAGLTGTAAQAVKDAYSGLRDAVVRKFKGVSIEQLEAAPESPARQSVVAEDLARAGGEIDEELLALVAKLLEAIEAHAPGSVAAVGATFEDVKAASIEIGKVISSGSGVVMKRVDVGDVKVGDISAGLGSHPKT